MPRLLLLSNSRDPAGNFLKHPQPQIREFLGAGVKRVLFVPFASVMSQPGVYAERVRGPFGEMGYEITSIDQAQDDAEMTVWVRDAEAIAVGGGNTFLLLDRLHRRGLPEVIRERVAGGLPYIGWSAGSVIACPTIQTTNDMPIVAPASLRALGLVPFQINAHYTDFHPPGFQGETRAERLTEYVEVNPGVRVIGLPEGTMLRVEGEVPTLIGDGAAPIFLKGQAVRSVTAGEDLGELWRG